jgi:pimeloyl-ACP methyl ester carboxylesterase
MGRGKELTAAALLLAACATPRNGATRGGVMEKVVSKDGTPIAYWRSGKGPPLVLVHGTAADHTRWAPVLAKLEERFTVLAVDRRGRGGSGDAAEYDYAREFEDVAAVVDAAGEPAFLLGHSYGAFCSLEAARLTRNLRKLILYEPPLDMGFKVFDPEAIARLEATLAAGDREGVLTAFLGGIARASPKELEMMKALPSWQGRVAAAHTIPRELRTHYAYPFEPARFAELRTPTLLLLGGASPPFYKAAVEAVNGAVAGSRIAVLEGQQHVAMNTAPELFLREVLAFLSD